LTSEGRAVLTMGRPPGSERGKAAPKGGLGVVGGLARHALAPYAAFTYLSVGKWRPSGFHQWISIESPHVAHGAEGDLRYLRVSSSPAGISDPRWQPVREELLGDVAVDLFVRCLVQRAVSFPLRGRETPANHVAELTRFVLVRAVLLR
jgi:hypothetical protein